MRTLQTMMVISMGLLLPSMTVLGTTVNDKQIAQSVKVNWKQINYQKNVTLRHESKGLHKPAPNVSEQPLLSNMIPRQSTMIKFLWVRRFILFSLIS